VCGQYRPVLIVNRLANLTLVFKKDSPGILKNYRPISLIRIVGNVMERCVNKHIYNFVLENKIISSDQSGFTPGDYEQRLHN
jgi:hypothetical protein